MGYRGVVYLAGAVNKALAAVEDGQVVDEVHVAGLRLDFQLRGLRNSLDCVQRLSQQDRFISQWPASNQAGPRS